MRDFGCLTGSSGLGRLFLSAASGWRSVSALVQAQLVLSLGLSPLLVLLLGERLCCPCPQIF